jgi:hypothetical protein
MDVARLPGDAVNGPKMEVVSCKRGGLNVPGRDALARLAGHAALTMGMSSSSKTSAKAK